MARGNSVLDTFRSLYRDLRKRTGVKQVYYLYGDETFLIDLIQEQIEALVPEEQKDFNFDLVYGGESTSDRVLSMANSFPMMADKRVVIVRDFLKLDDQAGSAIEDFKNYFLHSNPQCVLCLIDRKKPDGRTETGKTLNKAAKKRKNEIGLYQFPKVEDHLLPNWIIDWTKHSHDMDINLRAAQILSQLVGQDLKLLSTEIEKLCTFVDSGREISLGDVKKITESYREYNVIELKEAVIKRDTESALKISEQMLLKSNNNAGEIIKTVGFFNKVFSDIWKITRLIEKGYSKDQIKTELGNPRAFYYQYRDAQNFRFSEMPRIFESLLDADRAAKGMSTLDSPTIFLLLIKRMIG